MAIVDVRGFDDDLANHNNDFNPITDEGWFNPADFSTGSALGTTYPFYLKHYNTAESAEIGATGTGLFNPFLNMNGDSTLLGFNTNDDIKKPYTDAGLDISDPNTDAIQLGDIPIVYRDLDGNGSLEGYYLINLDINENVQNEVSLEELQIYTSTASATLADYHFDEPGTQLAFANNPGDAATDFTLRFDLNLGSEDNELTMRDDGAGQGKLDYTFYFPVTMFAGALPSDYLTLFSQFGPSPPDDAGFAEWNVLVAAKIVGVKFFDRNGDGVRDADGADNNINTTADNESGLAGFTMYIDLNNNNKLDVGEATAVSGADGSFQFASLLPNSQYIIREVLTAADVGAGLNFADYDPPAGLWDQTTGDVTGDQVYNVTTGTTNILVGNRLLVPNVSIDKVVVGVFNGDDTPDSDGAVDDADDYIQYKFIVTNTGEVDLTGVTVTDPLTGADIDIGNLAVGASYDTLLDGGEVTIYEVTQADIDGNGPGTDGDIDNTATVTTDQNVTDDDDEEVPVDYAPDVSIDKVVVGVFNEGGAADEDGEVDSDTDYIQYKFVVTNTGNVTLHGVTVTDPLTGADIDVGTLAVGASYDTLVDGGVVTTYDVQQSDIDDNGPGTDGDIDNTATVTTDEGPEDDDSEEVPVDYAPDVSIDKVVVGVFNSDDTPDSDGAVDDADDYIQYKFIVTNTGNVTLTGVTVTDPLTGADIDVGTLGVGESYDTLVDGGVVTTYDVQQSDIDDNGPGTDGDIDNTATVTTDQDVTDDDSEEVPVDYAPDVSLDKVVVGVFNGDDTPDSDGEVDDADDYIQYKFVVTNTGNVTLHGVTVTDPLTGADIDVGTLAPGASYDTLLDGGVNTYYDVQQSDIDDNGPGTDGDIDNTATVTTDEGPTDDDSEEVPVDYAPDVSLDKVVVGVFNGDDTPDSDGEVDDADDYIQYKFVVTNTGNVTLHGVTVTDPLTGADIDVGTLAPGASYDTLLDGGVNTYYDVQQSDIDDNGPGTDGDIDNTATVTTDEGPTDDDSEEVPVDYAPDVSLDKVVVGVFNGDDTPDTDGEVDDADDYIQYKFVVTNTGNVTLHGVTVTDPLTGADIDVGTLAPGASYDTLVDGGVNTYYEVTQADIDDNGPGTDSDIDNTATVTTDEGPTDDDSEEVPVDYSPDVSIDKVVVGVFNGDDTPDSDGAVDDADDYIQYKFVVTNTGNVTLHGVTVTDPLTGADIDVGTLAVGASYDTLVDGGVVTTYDVQQSDIDDNGPETDGDIDNTATVTTDEGPTDDDSEEVPVDYNPLATVAKDVSVDGVTWEAADLPEGPEATFANDPIHFRVVISNTGNVTLTGITLDDQLHDYASNTDSAIDYTTVDAYVDLDGEGDFDVGEAWSTLDADSDGTLDNVTLAVGDSLTVYYDLPFAAGQHTNTVTLTTNEADPVDNAANYFGLVDLGPGVRTPGFWQNPRNGGTFWDGNDDNQAHEGPDFPDHDLLQFADSNCDGTPDADGLLIGDYNLNGYRDGDEDVIFISYANALKLIDASNKKGNDTIYTLGRDVVAAWLNFSAGTNIDPTSGDPANIANAPKHYLDDAIDWLQEFASNQNDSSVNCAKFEFDASMKASNPNWKDAQTDDGIDHSGGAIHSALGSYNEDGTINGQFYAGDAEDSSFLFALNHALIV